MTLNVPEALEKQHEETVNFLAAKLYEAGKLSLGQAADMCGVDKEQFVSILDKFEVSYIQYSYEDILNDVARTNA